MDSKDLDRLAKLARLHIADEEHNALIPSLNKILTFVECLDSADIADIEPLYHPSDMYQRLRIDTIEEGDQSKALKDIAPTFHDGFYTVPKILD